jgi:hypothetical protein
MKSRTIAITSISAIALPLLMTAVARAGGNPGYYSPGTAGYAQPVQQLPPIVVRPPSPFEMFATGIFDIVAAPIGMLINVVSAPFIVAAPFQNGYYTQPAPLAYAAPQVPPMMSPPPMPRYHSHERTHYDGSAGCYDERGVFIQPASPECR